VDLTDQADLMDQADQPDRRDLAMVTRVGMKAMQE
jgi:hypothetical protein